MTECLITKKSNCKNCYKCIRNCPVKALSFTKAEEQAHIIRDECVLCGKCYVVCPQNAKQIRNDADAAKALINSGAEVYASVAPSFAAKYPGISFADMAAMLKKLGFTDAFETAVGAEIVAGEYEKIINEGRQRIIISSCCPTVNMLIEKHYKNAVQYLAHVVTPMQAHVSELKKQHPGCRVVFIGPCISKKKEAEINKSADAVLTFPELDGWLEECGVKPEHVADDEVRARTRLFPTSGGILGSMSKNSRYDYLCIDGIERCMDTLRDIESGGLDNCFIEMSSCSGSCVYGPTMQRETRNPARDEMLVKRFSGDEKFNPPAWDSADMSRKFDFIGVTHVMPGSAAIESVLKQMGKTSPDKELNCGSCGYNTCREKAAAVIMGKADPSMCMPFLKDKAESFSDTVISNTPNGIIVLDEQLNIQQMNSAARDIFNLPYSADISGEPAVRILDPIDYIMVLNDGKNVYDKRRYLAEYKKYIEETIIYDKEYHIVMHLMKDVTQEEAAREEKEEKSKAAVEITDKVVEKQMRIVQEIASLLGETTAETKIALTKLKETLRNE